MPSPSEPLIDERFRELAALLRDARPRPSERLREQVRELALAPPAAPAHRLRVRRLVPLAIAVAVTAAVAGGAALPAERGGGVAAPGAPFRAGPPPPHGRAPGAQAAP